MENELKQQKRTSEFEVLRNQLQSNIERAFQLNERLSNLRQGLTNMLDESVPSKSGDSSDIDKSTSMYHFETQVETLSQFLDRIESNVSILEASIG